MRFLSLIALLMILALPARAYDCPPLRVAEAYDEANRIFLMQVTQTRFEPGLYRQYYSDYLTGEPAEKLISVRYNILEEFKGDPQFQPVILEMLGLNTGYVGFVPGKYYLVMLPNVARVTPELYAKNLTHVSACQVPFHHYRLGMKTFQKELDKFRTLRQNAVKTLN